MQFQTQRSDQHCHEMCLLSEPQNPLPHLSTLISINVSGYESNDATVNVTIPAQSKPVPLMSMNGWLVILSRVDNYFPLNQTWTIYKSSFGNVLSNYWLGLENLFQLTSEHFMSTCGKFYRLRFEMQCSASGR